VATVVNDKIYLLRRARGFAPYPVMLPLSVNKNIVGLGAHLKCTLTFKKENYCFVSQYIGDLDDIENIKFYENTYEKMKNLFGIIPDILVSDFHENYYSSEFAKKTKIQTYKIQHHRAHMYSCMAENSLTDNVIGVIFDGTGIGDDGAVWGSEIFSMRGNVEREFHLQYVNQPGGDSSAKNPYMMLIAYLIAFELIDIAKSNLLNNFNIKKNQINLIEQMIDKSLNSPLTSSMGRFFEAIGFLLSGVKTNEFEGHTAILLESLAENSNKTDEYYGFEVENGIIYFKTTIKEIMNDYMDNIDNATIALKFHNTIVEIISHCCSCIRKSKGLNDVVLSGGVFQNILLLKKTILSLRKRNFNVFIHSKVPANDGGISLGQIYGYILENKH
jgi:hydrogenase maturation protein HypF